MKAFRASGVHLSRIRPEHVAANGNRQVSVLCICKNRKQFAALCNTTANQMRLYNCVQELEDDMPEAAFLTHAKLLPNEVYYSPERYGKMQDWFDLETGYCIGTLKRL